MPHLYLATDGGAEPDYDRFFTGEPADLRGIGGIVEPGAGDSGRGIIQVGLLLLFATPVARVASRSVAFALQRDHTYVVVTLIVLAVLLYSLLAGGQA